MVSRSRWGRKAVFGVAAVAILALSFSATAAFAGAVTFKDAQFSGYSSGTVAHADLLQMGDSRLVNADEAFTGASVNTAGLPAITNELERVVSPANADKKSYGRGAGIDVGINQSPSLDGKILLAGKSESAAPPTTNLDTKDLLSGNIPANPLLYASLLRGQSRAQWDPDVCPTGDISFGRGSAADVQLLSTTGSNVGDTGLLDKPLVATDSSIEDQGRTVASSYSHEFLGPQTNSSGAKIGAPGAFGLTSEVRMTIAPVTLLKGTPNEFTIEFLGEWVLSAVAGGIPGSAYIHYGPGAVNPQTPVLSLIRNGVVSRIITLQQILGNEGIDIPIPNVADIRVGEDPRALGNSDPNSTPQVAGDGTSASAALDVVKVTLLETGSTHAADIRIGHMEVKAQVPVNGIDCGIPVTKSANPPGVEVSQSFIVSIKIDNPFGCDLTAVRATDDITTRGDARFEVTGTSPTADTVPAGSNRASGMIIWNNIGSIPKGTSKTITTTIKAEGGGGEIDDVANVSAVLGGCEGQGEGNQMVGKSIKLRVPVVLKLKLPPTGVGTSTATFLVALTLISLAGVTIRQMRRTA